MKKILLSLGLVLGLVLGAQGVLTSYPVTNDLNSIFAVFYWTNNAGVYTTSLTTNLAPGSNTVFSVSTNGVAGLGLQPTNSTSPILMPWPTLPTNGGNLSIIFVNAMQEIAPALETVPQNQLVLKSYFITGALPSQANYWEFIDTMYWYVTAIYTNSQTAVAAAQQAQQSPLVAELQFTLITTPPYITTTHSFGIASNACGYSTSSGGKWHITNYFSATMPDTDYDFYFLSRPNNLGFPSDIFQGIQANTYCVFNATNCPGDTIRFLIYK
jgi:hypothetical protein